MNGDRDQATKVNKNNRESMQLRNGEKTGMQILERSTMVTYIRDRSAKEFHCIVEKRYLQL